MYYVFDASFLWGQIECNSCNSCVGCTSSADRLRYTELISHTPVSKCLAMAKETNEWNWNGADGEMCNMECISHLSQSRQVLFQTYTVQHCSREAKHKCRCVVRRKNGEWTGITGHNNVTSITNECWYFKVNGQRLTVEKYCQHEVSLFAQQTADGRESTEFSISCSGRWVSIYFLMLLAKKKIANVKCALASSSKCPEKFLTFTFGSGADSTEPEHARHRLYGAFHNFLFSLFRQSLSPLIAQRRASACGCEIDETVAAAMKGNAVRSIIIRRYFDDSSRYYSYASRHFHSCALQMKSESIHIAVGSVWTMSVLNLLFLSSCDCRECGFPAVVAICTATAVTMITPVLLGEIVWVHLVKCRKFAECFCSFLYLFAAQFITFFFSQVGISENWIDTRTKASSWPATFESRVENIYE